MADVLTDDTEIRGIDPPQPRGPVGTPGAGRDYDVCAGRLGFSRISRTACGGYLIA
jgi:hypothetical protein